MLHSMTGFARQSAETPLGTLTWELKAVNHRYLDIQFRLPDEFRPQEQVYRGKVQQYLDRGKIECALHLKRDTEADTELEVDTAFVERLGARIDAIRKILPETAAPNSIDVLRWPGVIRQVEMQTEPLFEAAAPLLDAALESIAGMRSSEGERIAGMLESRLADVARVSAAVRERMPEVLDAARRKQGERIERLDVEADPGRLEVELALIAQKLDVDEELDRLDSHVTEIRDIIATAGPVGRRLDFLMQELNREANTLGSKSGDTETSRAAVELKVLIEQMREQIQNVE